MADFISRAEFKARIGTTVTNPPNDDRIDEHIAAASGRVRLICHRDFSPHVGDATVRYFRPLDCSTVWIDDAYEITAVAVDTGNDGTYATTWSAADYETDPANGIGPDGQTGWPVTTLRMVGTSFVLPTWTSRRAVKVTAKWGWSAVPAPVKEATYLLTNRLSYEVQVPGGVTAPNVDFGIPGQPLRRQYTAEDLLRPYIRHDQAIGVA